MERFGELVIGGNGLVGFVVFIILIMIQFVVIRKGGEGVCEVGGRFRLDGMGGKEMRIDGDLNGGMI